ncbi:MAG: hypothetical protein AUG51_12055 [Acidobacteria bacterium 13_1_20CM_3_53_8]|nr:MAG: hypothetical protein AUG51_12055 [Acidobacteria bacterium 13_1_20CM_3_53_8]
MGSRSFILNPSSPVIHLLMALSICVAVLSIGNSPPKLESINFTESSEPASEDEIDARLQLAATEALGTRDGAVVIMDAQTGRVRTIVNPSLAIGQAFPPGSTIKPFTALAALQSHLIDEDSRLLCHGGFHRENFSLNCSHPKISAPFNPSQALAYSCNFYFGELGGRLRPSDFTSTLASFGFGQPIGFGEGEEVGKIPSGRLNAGDALGESDRLLVTPLQLLAAYSALINGGHLNAPQLNQAASFTPRERARIEIAQSHRAVLIEGMRGAIKYGTAAHSGLNQLPLKIIGKTGTATEVGGFRTNGWFVGFAADESAEIISQPEAVKLAVLVFLKHSHGAECAEVSQKIFDEFARLGSSGDRGGRQHYFASNNRGPSQGGSVAPSHPEDSLQIRVHLVGQNVTQTLSLEDYVLGVLAAEASWETELEALKAQAIVTRTFALKNLKRHGSEGFDFCSTTHCQRFVSFSDGTNHPTELMRRAVAETSGQVLRDEQGHLIDAYFHAACGGVTARIDSLWGAHAVEYLRGVRDIYCEGMPHHSWTDTILASQLAYALQRDARTDVGPNLNQIIVTKRDVTGRAETIMLVGETRRTVRGWDFKLIVGRTLGWNFIKSSRFEVTRAGESFVFRGSGFGHGLGLCQEGAHVMAQRGMPTRAILIHYFPTTHLSSAVRERAGEETGRNYNQPALHSDFNSWRADVLSGREVRRETSSAVHGAKRNPLADSSDSFHSSLAQFFSTLRASRSIQLSSEHFRLNFPASVGRRDAEFVLRTLEAARASMQHRLAIASLRSELPMVDVVIHETTGDFVSATGEPYWAAGATRGNRIEMQPLEVLRRRGVLPTTLRHEFVHTVIAALSHGGTPHWLEEGLAIYVAGEGAQLARSAFQLNLTTDELAQRLERPSSPEEMRSLYFAAYREVQKLIRTEGEASVWRRAFGIR